MYVCMYVCAINLLPVRITVQSNQSEPHLNNQHTFDPFLELIATNLVYIQFPIITEARDAVTVTPSSQSLSLHLNVHL